jgi:hypothetical protein
VLQFQPSITSHLFPVSFLLVAGGLLASSTLFAQDNQWTKIPENQWINLPDFSTQQATEPQVYVTAKRATPAIMRAVRTQASPYGRQLTRRHQPLCLCGFTMLSRPGTVVATPGS